MVLETAQLYVSDADEAAIVASLKALPGLRDYRLGRNMEGCWGAGSHTLDLWWEGSPGTLEDALKAVQGYQRVDRVLYGETVGSGLRDPGLRDGIWRTLLLQVRPDAGPDRVAGLEQELLGMPVYMAGIRNWRLSRVASAPGGWTHVWQQEYAALDDLMGEYLLHPYHWGWVDRRFDPEFPEWTVGPICHAFCPLPSSVLALDP